MKLYIMYKVHMTSFNEPMKAMSHLKFNAVLARTLKKKGTCFILKATTMVGAFVPNLAQDYIIICNG